MAQLSSARERRMRRARAAGCLCTFVLRMRPCACETPTRDREKAAAGTASPSGVCLSRVYVVYRVTCVRVCGCVCVCASVCGVCRTALRYGVARVARAATSGDVEIVKLRVARRAHVLRLESMYDRAIGLSGQDLREAQYEEPGSGISRGRCRARASHRPVLPSHPTPQRCRISPHGGAAAEPSRCGAPRSGAAAPSCPA
mmetsp:Transcript_29020/g.97248  ORF Transcript_29020/g.97248 Transcript_29020/m.97248 type:complete len:200 (+) Transcript_29020:547-1146(+)